MVLSFLLVILATFLTSNTFAVEVDLKPNVSSSRIPGQTRSRSVRQIPPKLGVDIANYGVWSPEDRSRVANQRSASASSPARPASYAYFIQALPSQPHTAKDSKIRKFPSLPPKIQDVQFGFASLKSIPQFAAVLGSGEEIQGGQIMNHNDAQPTFVNSGQRSKSFPSKSNFGYKHTPSRYHKSQSPLVREYDPYNKKFNMISVTESHDSSESYAPPIIHAGHIHKPLGQSEETSSPFPTKILRPEMTYYQVGERGNQYYVQESNAEPECKNGKHKNTVKLLSSLKRPTPFYFQYGGHPESLSKHPSNALYNSKFLGNQHQRGPLEAEHKYLSAHRHRRPRGRKRLHHGRRRRPAIGHHLLRYESQMSTDPTSTSAENAKAPIFEFKNPVYNLVMGDESELDANGPPGSAAGDNIQDHEGSEEAVPDKVIVQAIQEPGDAEAAAIDDQIERKLASDFDLKRK